MKYPTTPDGRYFVVKNILWRSANPALTPDRRAELQKDLMNARRQCRKANLATKTADQVRAIRALVDDAKVALGERGPIWWEDEEGVGDLNRHGVKKSPYKDWYEGLAQGEEGAGEEQGQGQGRTGAASSGKGAAAKAKVAKVGKSEGKAEGGKTRTARKYGLRSGDKSGPAKEESDDDE